MFFEKKRLKANEEDLENLFAAEEKQNATQSISPKVTLAFGKETYLLY